MPIDVTPLHAIGVVRVLSDLAGCEWRREGTWFVTRCPFHDDSTPSFKVGSQKPHRGRCYACDADGDVIQLAARLRETTFLDACKWLTATYCNGAGPSPAPAPAPAAPPASSDVAERDWGPLYATAFELCDDFETGPVAEWLADRKILGAALAGGDVGAVHHSGEWFSGVVRLAGGRDEARAAGLLQLYVWARHDVPLVVCAHRTAGGVVTQMTFRPVVPVEGVQARFMLAGHQPGPFGVSSLARARGGAGVVLCEGATDALTWHRFGHAALGVPGLQQWRPWYLDLLEPGTPVAVVPDDDEAGAGAERWALDAAERGFPVRVCSLRAMPPQFRRKDANACLVAGAEAAHFRAVLDAGRLPEARFLPPASRVRRAGANVTPTPAQQADPPGPPVTEARQQLVELVRSRIETLGGGSVEAGAVAVAAAAAPAVSGGAGEAQAPADGDAADSPADGRPRWDQDEAPRGGDGEQESLPDLIEWLHYDIEGNKRHDRVKPPHRLTDAVIQWFRDSGGVFLRDSSGRPFLYWGGRLLAVERTNPDWRGFLYKVGKVILDDPEGKLIACAMQQHALADREGPRLAPWTFLDVDRSRLAVHLHGRSDQVLYVRCGAWELARNGSHGLLLEPDERTREIRLPRTLDAEAALEALDRLVVQNLATSRTERSLFVCWVLSSLLRHALQTKALLFCHGASGSGKSEATKLATALLHGEPRVIVATNAALYEETPSQPFLALDNQETQQIAGNESLQQFLLLSSTGAVRKKRRVDSPRGTTDQRTDALVAVTAIEPPALDELIQRTLVVTFDRELHRKDFQAGPTLRALTDARGVILGGILRLVAETVLERLGDVSRYEGLVPPEHPKRRLGQHLALMALLADVCHQVRPTMWGAGSDELRRWLVLEGSMAVDQATGTDPIVAGLDRLIWSWNRVARAKDRETSRPAWDGAWYRTRPAFRAAQRSLDGRPAGWTDQPKFAADQHPEDDRPVVAGLVGSYEDLLADLHRAEYEERGTGELRRRIATVAQFSARWKSNRALQAAGWSAAEWNQNARPRTYLFARGLSDDAAPAATH